MANAMSRAIRGIGSPTMDGWRSDSFTGRESNVRGGELLEHAPLVPPVDGANDPPQVPLVETVDGREKKDLFLNIRREIEQFHDLRDAGTRDVAAPGKFRVVANRSIGQQSFKPDSQGHEPGDSGNRVANQGRLAFRYFRRARIERIRDLLTAVHTCTSGAATG